MPGRPPDAEGVVPHRLRRLGWLLQTQRADDRHQIRLCRGLSRNLIDHTADRRRRL
jgi:hypothetical protein